MKNIYEIQQFVKKFGTIMYVGDRVADLELLEEEIKELYRLQLIDPNDFQTAILILRHEIRLLKEKQEKDR